MPIGAPIPLDAYRAHVSEEYDGELPHVAVQPSRGELLPGDGIRSAQDGQPLRVYGTHDPDRQARAWEGMAPHDLRRQPEFESHLADLIFEEGAQRLHQGEGQVIGEAAHVVVALDICRARAATRLHHIGIERALHEEVHRASGLPRLGDDVARSILEHPDEFTSDDFALLLRVGHASKSIEEAPLGVDNDQTHARRGDEVALDLLGFTGAQETVIDEHAGELLTHRALHQRRRDR